MGGDAGKDRDKCSAMSEKTVRLIHSLEDSLAHWCTIDPCGWSAVTIVTEHQ